MLMVGALVNGPYALITTAVSADLGQHKSLRGDATLMSTVTAIIDGCGSVGAAMQGYLVSWIASTYVLGIATSISFPHFSILL